MLRLGLPILIGQLGMIVTSFADNIMVGHYSTEAMASASFVNNVFNVATLALIGFTYGITPLVGALYGGGRLADIGAAVRRGLRVNIIFCMVVIAIMSALYFNVERLGQPDELIPVIKPYYLTILVSMTGICVFNVMAQWSYAVGDTRMPMWIILFTNGLNVLGNWMMIYGHWGMPEMGLTGAGISTLVSRMICAGIIVIIFFYSKKNRVYLSGWRDRSLSPFSRSKIWKTSLPVSLQMAFETGAFSLSAIMAGWMGKIELAAFQIIVIVGTLGFCIYYALGAAISVKVANVSAAKDNPRAHMRRVARAGYIIMLILMTISSLTFVLMGRTLMAVFTNDAEVYTLAATLLVPLVLYQLGDATQVTFANALRGTSRVLPMVWIAFVSYIVVGVPSTYLLAFTASLGLWGIVLSFSVSLFLAGGLFLYFFLKATQPQKSVDKSVSLG